MKYKLELTRVEFESICALLTNTVTAKELMTERQRKLLIEKTDFCVPPSDTDVGALRTIIEYAEQALKDEKRAPGSTMSRAGYCLEYLQSKCKGQ